jgi:H+/Cl- antiporter ClcA
MLTTGHPDRNQQHEQQQQHHHHHHNGNGAMNEPLLLSLQSPLSVISQSRRRPRPSSPRHYDAFQSDSNPDYHSNFDRRRNHNDTPTNETYEYNSDAANNDDTNNDDTNNDDDDDDDDDDVYQQENAIHVQALLHMWGRPYAAVYYCTCFLDLVVAGLLGFVVGGCGLGFLVATHWLRRQWKMRITIISSYYCIILTSSSTATTTIMSFLISSFTTTTTTTTTTQEQQEQINAAASSCQDSSLWFLLIVTSLGGFLTAMTFCILHPRTSSIRRRSAQPMPMPMPRSIMSIPVRTMFHDLNSFPHQHPPATDAAAAASSAAVVTVLASFWTLASGAPLGPEQALGSMATMIACCLRSKAGGHEQQQQQQQLEWIRIGTAAMVGGLLGNPLLGPIFVQELSSRFVVQIPPEATRSAPPVRDEPLEATLSGRERRRQLQQQQQQQERQQLQHSTIQPPVHHDYMHGWVLQLVASLFAGLWMQVWFPEWLPYHALAALPLQHQQQHGDSGSGGGAINPKWMLYWNTTGRNLVLAIPIGLVCGLLGTIAICIMVMTRWIRHATCRLVLRKMTTTSTTMTSTSCGTNMMRTFLLVLFPTLAGLIHGCLTWYVVSPRIQDGGGSDSTLMMDGLSFLQSIWNKAAAAAANATRIMADDGHDEDNAHHDNGIDDGSTAFLYSRQTLVVLMMVQILGMAISLGWGLVGGNILPMLVAGLCMGLALVKDTHDDDDNDVNNCTFLNLPISLTVPCCMAAMVVSICPIPLSMTFGICTVFRFHHASSTDGDGNDSVTIMGPVMVACLTAWTVTGGTGFLYRCEKAQIESDRTSLSQTAGVGGDEEGRSRVDHFSSGNSGYDGDENDNDDGDGDDEYTGAGLTSDASSDDELLRNVRSAIFGRI